MGVAVSPALRLSPVGCKVLALVALLLPTLGGMLGRVCVMFTPLPNASVLKPTNPWS